MDERLQIAVIAMAIGNPKLLDSLNAEHFTGSLAVAVKALPDRGPLVEWVQREFGIPPGDLNNGVRAALMKRLERRAAFRAAKRELNRRQWEIAVFGEAVLDIRKEDTEGPQEVGREETSVVHGLRQPGRVDAPANPRD